MYPTSANIYCTSLVFSLIQPFKTMRSLKPLLLAGLLYSMTSCEKATVTPDASHSTARISTEQAVTDAIVGPILTTTYRYTDYNGSILILSSSPTGLGYIRNKNGVQATIKPPYPPCYPSEPGCPPGKSVLTCTTDPISSTLNVSIRNNVNSMVLKYRIEASSKSFFTAYKPYTAIFYRTQ